MEETVVTWIFKAFDVLKVPRLFEFTWRLLTRTSPLTQAEIDTASEVLGRRAIQYRKVCVAQGGLLRIIFKLNRGRPFVTFHTINFPSSGRSSRLNLAVVVHELVHVYQFERLGSVYIWQALRAQRTTGYRYGQWQQLKQDWNNGRHFRNYNREQQGRIAQDYYSKVIEKGRLAEDPIRQAYEPFINELRNGDL